MSSAAIFNEFVSKLSLALNVTSSSTPIIREEATLPVQEPTIVEGGVDASQAIEDVFKGGNLISTNSTKDPSEIPQIHDSKQEIPTSTKNPNEIDQNLDLDSKDTTISDQNTDQKQEISTSTNSTKDPNEIDQNLELEPKEEIPAKEPVDLDGNPDPQISQKGGEIYENDPPQLADTIQNIPSEKEESEKQEEKNEIDDGVIADPYENEESHSNDEPDLEHILPSDASTASDISLTNSDDGSSSGDEMFEETLKAVTAYRLKHSTPSLSGGDASSNLPPGVVQMHGGAKSVTPQSKMLTIINEYPWVIKKN